MNRLPVQKIRPAAAASGAAGRILSVLAEFQGEEAGYGETE